MAIGKQLSDKNPDGVSLGQSATDTISFYGATPVSQRSSSSQATSNLSTASSTAIDTQSKAAIIEIMNTLVALGLYKGA